MRLLASYPAPLQVNLTRPDAPSVSECVARLPEPPSYKELEGVLRGVEWSMSRKPLPERLALEARFLRESALAPPPPKQD